MCPSLKVISALMSMTTKRAKLTSKNNYFNENAPKVFRFYETLEY